MSAENRKNMENVYNLAAKDEQQELQAYAIPSAKKKLYSSIHPKEYCTVPHRPMKTLGPAKVAPDDHTNWLKKGSQHPPLPDPSKYTYEDAVPRREPIPAREDVPIHGLRSTKNFIQSNVIDATVKVPPPTDKADLDWTTKDHYGEVPPYLAGVKDQVAKEQAMLRTLEKEYSGIKERLAYRLDPEERVQLLAGLKNNWLLLNQEYTTQLKMVPETFGQKNRKMWLETRLADLENDVAIMERDEIYVQED